MTDRSFHWHDWRWRWHVSWNVLLVAGGVALFLGGTWRGLFLIVLVPIAFLPFSWARLRLEGVVARAAQAARVRPAVIGALIVAGVLLDIVMVAQLLTARSPSLHVWLDGAVMGWVGPVWYSTHAVAAVALLIVAGFASIGRWAGALTDAGGRRAGDEPLVSRRQLLRNAGAVGAAVPFYVSVSGARLSYDFRLEEHEIELPRWPAALDGLRLVHLSDIHVGGAMDGERLAAVVELTERGRPDLVCHTGDFLTHRAGDFDAPLYDALARIRPRYGQWACLGNHDYDDPARFTRLLTESGVRVLRDEIGALRVDGTDIEIGGLDFCFNRLEREESYARTVAHWPAVGASPRIVLNHDPSGFWALPAGCADLVLSGHTHGGHVGIQLGKGRALSVVGLVGVPDQGLFERGAMRMFVTRCVGFYGYPMRIGIPPEIAVLVLRAPKRTAA